MCTLKLYFRTSLSIVVLLISLTTYSQEIDPNYLTKPWSAGWIFLSKQSSKEFGLYYFRKEFELTLIPQKFMVHVSADNRYKLFVNEKMVSVGPARGDFLHWNFETIDLAPYLKTGKNVVAAQVWNEGELKPEANLSAQTGFILQGGTTEAQVLNSNSSWKCIQDKGYSPMKVLIPTFFVAGAGERMDMHQHITGWQKLDYDDSKWQSATTLTPGIPKNKVGYGNPNSWMLVPSALPQMELKPQRLAALRKAEGVSVPDEFPAAKNTVIIPANKSVKLLLDQSFLTNAYPTIVFSGGNNSKIELSYQESLFTKYPAKGNRNEVEGKIFVGRKDSIISDGSQHQEYTTLSWRTYRYIQLNITTKETPLVLEDIYGTFTGFPFELKAKLETESQELQKMFETGWRTAQLCAVETYMDCPYYEQLQYIGDTRIQALVSLYNSGDDRLVRNFLNQIDYSRQPEGVTQSRYPTTTPQYITPFSLWYIGAVHDYMMYANDGRFVAQKLVGVRQILNYFNQFQQQDGSVKNLPWWNFTDWVYVPNWPLGARSAGKDGTSALIDLQLLWAYELAADMESKLGMNDFARLYLQSSEQLKKTIRSKYWDKSRKLFADRSEKDLFSQHTNALAILTGMVSQTEAREIAAKLLTDNSLAPASIYFKYYLHQALTVAGLGNDYLKWLDKWKENLSMGLTTWAETSDVDKSRSDCHAWGASPNIEFFRIILGVDSDTPGFNRVKIEPHLGDITQIGGEMPHPNGLIRVKYTKANGHLQAEIELPAAITGRFIWQGKSYELKGGKNSLKI